MNEERERKNVHKQAKLESQRNVTYHKNKKKTTKKKHNTDDSGEALGEEMRHVQMSKSAGEASVQVKEASSNS